MHALMKEQFWDFDAGLLPLDFANTAEWHAGPNPTERLNSYTNLVGWSWAAGILVEQEAKYLLEQAIKHPKDAAETLAKAIGLREAIYQVFSANTAGAEAPLESIKIFNTALTQALSHACIVPSGLGYSWGWSEDKQSLDRMLWPILRSTMELLISDDLKRVGICADDRGCGYLFFDASRNRSRRWCSMEACGNRAKVRRHYNQTKARA
jgi:predicted RNA-binding Zn ribbon-like protein